MMKITKFGGSSVANAQQFRKVKHIIESDPARRFVVVSASEHMLDIEGMRDEMRRPMMLLIAAIKR